MRLFSDRLAKGQGEGANSPWPVMSARDASAAPRRTDVGARLIELAPKMRAIAGSRLAIDAEVACPRSLVRIDGEQFDAAMLTIVENAVAAGARNIDVRNHTVGTRIWTLISDDGRNTSSLQALQARAGADDSGLGAAGFSLVHDFALKAHGNLLVRAQPGVGTCLALVLPTMLSIAGKESLFPPKEKTDEQDRQSVAA